MLEHSEDKNRLNRSYLVRFWRHRPSVGWRVTVQDVRSKECHHFARVEELWAFLEQDLGREGKR